MYDLLHVTLREYVKRQENLQVVGAMQEHASAMQHAWLRSPAEFYWHGITSP